MTVKDLQSVLIGDVVLYEEIPDGGKEDMFLIHFRDLYTGMSRQIPEEYLQREVRLIRGRENRSDIELLRSAAGRREKKKEHRKSPA